MKRPNWMRSTISAVIRSAACSFVELHAQRTLNDLINHQIAEMRKANKSSKLSICISAAGLFFVAVGLFISGYNASIAGKQANIATETLHATQRPWVTASKVIIDDLEKPNAADNPGDPGYFPIEFRITFKNTGQSIATRGFPNITLTTSPNKALEDGLCDGPTRMNKGFTESTFQSGLVLAPQADFIFSTAAGNDHVDYRNVLGGGAWLIGCLVYSDGFGHPHTTKFCYVTRGRSDGTFPLFEQCGTGEYAD